MNLTINGSPAVYRAEEGETLLDLLRAFQDAIRVYNHRLVEWRAQPLTEDPQGTKLASLEEVTLVTEEVQLPSLPYLEALIGFLDSLGRGLVSRNPQVLENCRAVAPELPALLKTSAQLGLRLSAAAFDTILHGLEKGWEGLQDLGPVIDQCQDHLEKTRIIHSNPSSSLETLSQLLRQSLQEASSMPNWLFGGEIPKAMGVLAQLLEHYTLLEIAMEANGLSRSESGSAEELRRVMEELQGALVGGDWTYVSDLLEYEILPRMTETVEFCTIELERWKDAASKFGSDFPQAG